MTQHTWKIISIDATLNSMITEYAFGEHVLQLNIPMPEGGTTTAEWVSKFAPTKLLHTQGCIVEVGDCGEVEILVEPVEEPVEVPNTSGSWGEEYLRAMIYQVMEEIRDDEV